MVFGVLGKFRGFFMSLYYSLNPLSYKQLSTRPLTLSFKYLFLLLLLSFLATLILFMPILANLQGRVTGTLSKFSEFKVDANIETTGPAMIIPGIIVDTTGNVTEPNPVLVTKENVEWVNFKCFAFRPLCLFSKKEEKISSVEFRDSNILENQEILTKLVPFFVFFMVPAILLFLYIVFLVKYLLLITIFSFLAFIITRMLLFEIEPKAVLNTAIYSSTLMIVPEILNLRFNLELFYIPLAAYIAFFITGIFLIGKKHDKERGK